MAVRCATFRRRAARALKVVAFIPLLAWTCIRPGGAALAASPDWQAVEQALGRQGTATGEVFKATFPRTDLDVRVGDLKVAAGLALGSWAAFQPAGDGATVMGDLVLLEPEVRTVVERLAGGPAEVTAVHNHLQGERPAVWYVHIGGHGDPVELARAIRSALETTRTPLGPAPQPGEASGAQGGRSLDQAAIERTLGRSGKLNGQVLGFSVPRAETIRMHGVTLSPAMGVATAINFQPAPDGAATTGDFVLLADEVRPVTEALVRGGLRVTALHSHMLGEEPRLYFMHFFGTGDPERLAAGLKAALSETNTRQAKE